jgi:hypothetical protein
MSEVKALIVAATMAQASAAAHHEQLRPGEWKYLDDPIQTMGLRPRDGLKLIVNEGVWLPDRSYEIIDRLESVGFKTERIYL